MAFDDAPGGGALAPPETVLRRFTYLLPCLVLATVAAVGGTADASGYTRVFVNGVPVPVHFNDGDSFRVFDGEYRGSQCRLAGFNTLESFGPGHQWGDWHPYELYINAKQATYNGRDGVWHCTTDGSRDTYGRVLMICPDLAIDQIRKGLAHAYEVEGASPPEYLRAQQEAIRHRRGMWAHGVPDYIMTSIHSADEDPGREWHYNRLISTRDGHSESMRHQETYSECEWVCDEEIRVDLPRVRAAARRLREDPRIAPQLTDLFNLHLVEIVSRFHRTGDMPDYYLDEPTREIVRQRLESEQAQGLLGETHTARGSCMIHVPFERRYGQDRAACLRGHGNWEHH